MTFKKSGKTYYFPFRVFLEPVRRFEESLVRPEFAYVAENLLLRGGYGKTHFQADQTTLQAVSQMGSVFSGSIESYNISAPAFTPTVTFHKTNSSPPDVYLFKEVILQALIKQHLFDNGNLASLLLQTKLSLAPENLEVLSERALPEGHIDILIKDKTPIGLASKIVVEVKLSKGVKGDLDQLKSYVNELGSECKGGLLIAHSFSALVVRYANSLGLSLFTYSFDGLDTSGKYTISQLMRRFRLSNFA